MATLLILMALIARASQPQQVFGADYLSTIDHRPLMEGLTETPDRTFVFDKSDGLMIKAYAESIVVQLTVRRFYRDILPRLGWT